MGGFDGGIDSINQWGEQYRYNRNNPWYKLRSRQFISFVGAIAHHHQPENIIDQPETDSLTPINQPEIAE